MGAVAGIDTDYLVVGAGAAGMAFADALIADSQAAAPSRPPPEIRTS
jgi:malic enzyme